MKSGVETIPDELRKCFCYKGSTLISSIGTIDRQ